MKGGLPHQKISKINPYDSYEQFSLFRLVNYKFLLLDHLRSYNFMRQIWANMLLSTKTDCRVKIAHENLHYYRQNTVLQYCRNGTVDKNYTARVPGRASLRLQNLVLLYQ